MSLRFIYTKSRPFRRILPLVWLSTMSNVPDLFIGPFLTLNPLRDLPGKSKTLSVMRRPSQGILLKQNKQRIAVRCSFVARVVCDCCPSFSVICLQSKRSMFPLSLVIDFCYRQFNAINMQTLRFCSNETTNHFIQRQRH